MARTRIVPALVRVAVPALNKLPSPMLTVRTDLLFIERPLDVTLPPLATVMSPVPELPRIKTLLVVQLEPFPLTVTVPAEPEAVATTAEALLTLAPLVMVSVPLPALPTLSEPELVQVEPAPSTLADA